MERAAGETDQLELSTVLAQTDSLSVTVMSSLLLT